MNIKLSDGQLGHILAAVHNCGINKKKATIYCEFKLVMDL